MSRINIFLFSIIVSLALYAAYTHIASVIGLAVSFAAYLVDHHVGYKPKHKRDLAEYELKLSKMEAKVNKMAIKMGFGDR